MVIHPRNLNLGERILRFAEWPPRGKQLVGPAAAAAAAPRRPPAGSPGPPAAPGRPAGSTGPAAPLGPLLLPGRPAGREHGRALASFPSLLPCTGRPRVGKRGSPVSACEARPGPHRSRPWGGRTEGGTQVPVQPRRRGPVGTPEAPSAPSASRRTRSEASLPPLGLHPSGFCLAKASQPKKLPTAVSLTPRGRSPPLSLPFLPAAY